MSEKLNEAAIAADEAAHSRGYRKIREGYVVSDKMDKTVVVEVEHRIRHRAVPQDRTVAQAAARPR